MTSADILRNCTHARESGICPACADRAIAAAVEAERARIEAVILRNIDGDWKHALIEDIRARGGSNG